MRAVTFDIWGTLLDLSKFYLALSKKLSFLSGRRFEELYDSILSTYSEALRVRLGGGFSRIIVDSGEFFSSKLGVSTETLFKAVATVLEDPEISKLAYPDAAEAVELVKSEGYTTATLGNVMFWPGAVTRYILHKNGLLKYFDLTVFSDEVGLQKPSREIFEYVAGKLKLPVEEIVHVGDSLENDLAGALMSGAKAVLVNRSLSIGIVKLGKSAYLVNSLKHLPEVLRELKKSG
ncbi:MAG: HAD family hydrolase [Sulfolobales archaeon]|nr:HAD family hydrolase [Sulfolobales archaeon]MCX8208743.1 HAD family hydrolase [Sulfolobales archaeon]MDW8010932.1 HAD family hydrolase [Sulfolobales archaeon]